MNNHDDHDNHEFDALELQRLQLASEQLPREITPANDAWPLIRERIERGRVRELGRAAPPLSVHRNRRRGALAVAATLLIAVSDAVATWKLNAPQSAVGLTNPIAVAMTQSVDAGPKPTTISTSPQSVNATMSRSFERYQEAASDLAVSFKSRREHLDPATVAVLDSCLDTIDNAIAESRRTLKRTPDNATVTELLELTYQQKLDLLRRAVELPLISF